MFNLKPLFSSASLLLAFTATAHTPYLAPASFEPLGGWVTLDAAFAEKFFVPEVAFDQSEFKVLQPDGHIVTPKELFLGKTRTAVAHQLEQDGTYKFSTGQRFGAIFRSWQQDGKTHNSRDPKEKIPAGAKLTAYFQSVTLAETYVSKGAPSQSALKPTNTGLELMFQSHPNDLYVQSPIKATVLYNGKALAGQKVQVYPANSPEAETKASKELTSDQQGRLNFELDKAGTYVLLTRFRTDAPTGAKAPTYSYSYSAVVEVTE
jgi:uncharacterized GH25 family protein